MKKAGVWVWVVAVVFILFLCIRGEHHDIALEGLRYPNIPLCLSF